MIPAPAALDCPTGEAVREDARPPPPALGQEMVKRNWCCATKFRVVYRTDDSILFPSLIMSCSFSYSHLVGRQTLKTDPMVSREGTLTSAAAASLQVMPRWLDQATLAWENNEWL